MSARLTPGESVAEMPSSRRSRRAFAFFVVYFGAMHAVPIWQMVTGSVPRVFIIVDTLGLGAGALGGLYVWRRIRTPGATVTTLEILVFAYLALAAVSVGLYLQPGNPVDVRAYLYGVHYVVFPGLTFFAVKFLEAREQARVLRLLVVLNFCLVGIGLVIFYWQPPFFTEYTIRSFQGEVTELWQVYGRVRSYLGSTTVGISAGLSLLLVEYYRFGTPLRAAVCSAFAIGGLLSQQRGGYLAVGIGLLYQAVLRSGRVARKLAWALMLSGLLAAILTVYARRSAVLEDRLDLLSYTANRLFRESAATDVMAERVLGYRRAWENLVRFPLGLGLGATLSASDSAGMNPGGQVVDANYMRILSDLGVPGLALFLTILAAAVWRAWQSSPRFLWLAVLAVYAMIAVGTNVFDSFYVSHVYWTLLGVIDAGGAVGRGRAYRAGHPSLGRP